VTLPGDAAPGLTYIGRAAEREDDDATGGGGVEWSESDRAGRAAGAGKGGAFNSCPAASLPVPG